MKSRLRSIATRPRPARRRFAPHVHDLEPRQLMATGFLQGTVFGDVNANNTLDPTELPIAGAVVDLYDATGTIRYGTRTTLADGYYVFDGLAAGDYKLVETPPVGYANVGKQALSPINPVLAGGTTASINVRVTDPSRFQTVTFNSADEFALPFSVVTHTFEGNTTGSSAGQLPIVVSGPSFTSPKFVSFCLDLRNDLYNGNNIFTVQAGEMPPTLDGTSHAGQIAYLYNHFTPFATTKIKSVGLQLAIWELVYDTTPDLNAGNFRDIAPYGSYSNAADVAAFVAEANSLLAASAGKAEKAFYLDAAPFTAPAGKQGMIASSVLNFGNDVGVNGSSAASLSGYVYHDANNDGSRSGEMGISGATVTLTGVNDAGATINLTATTDASGRYSFPLLRPGTYMLTETQPGAYLDGKDTIGTPGGTTSNDQFSNIVLTSGTNGVENNFGEVLASSLSGYVYHDANNDGSRAGDAPISGVTVTLTGTDDLGNSVSSTTTTNGSGYYSFTGLRPAIYMLTESQPSGYSDGLDTIGTQGGTTANDVFSNVVLNPGVSGVENNFGERLSSASIGDRVWLDSNLNGIQDIGECGVSGVTVKLKNSGGSVIATTTTNASGNYSFTGLAAGTYVVQFVLPSGYGFTLADVGTNDGVDSDANASTGLTGTYTLAAGQSNTTVDAGLYRVPTGEVIGNEGGTPGYWKNNANKKGASAWGPTGLSPSQTVASVFAATAGTSYGSQTLLQALGNGGGGIDALLRHAVAGLLNALHPNVHYSIYSTQLILQVNAAIYSGNSSTIKSLQTTLDGYNNKTHPLDQSGRRII